MSDARRGRPRSKKIATEIRWCEHHQRDCEHRLWRRGKRPNGEPREIWSCAELHNETNKAAYARQKEA